jgi:hypothetical protein
MVIILLALIYALNIIDYIQTTYAIQLFGLNIEANPIVRFLFEHNCAWVFKIILFPIALVIAGMTARLDKRVIWAICMLLALYLGAVINNFIVLFRLGAL